MSYIVVRTKPTGYAAYTGPMRTKSHADRERNAWRDAGWGADTVEYTAEIKAAVRAWEKAKRG